MIFEQFALAVKTEFVLKLIKPGGRQLPASYAYGQYHKQICYGKIYKMQS